MMSVPDAQGEVRSREVRGRAGPLVTNSDVSYFGDRVSA
jgi:hypothetical protein